MPAKRKPAPASAERDGDERRERVRPIAILLVEDNRLIRMGLAASIREQADLKLLASAREAEPGLEQGRQARPDVILLDAGLGERGCRQVVREQRARYPKSSLIVMGMIPPARGLLGLIQEGVSGFVLKDAPISNLFSTLRRVAAGSRVFPIVLTDSLLTQIADDTARHRAPHMDDVKLTTREREVVELIAGGLSNKEIAKRLSIATDTVKSHVHNILEKLSVRSRVEIAVRARARVPEGR